MNLLDVYKRQADLFLRLVIDIGQAFLDQDDGPVVELVEIVRRIAFQRPVETLSLIHICFFFGAFYLFFINTVFIALATYCLLYTSRCV